MADQIREDPERVLFSGDVEWIRLCVTLVARRHFGTADEIRARVFAALEREFGSWLDFSSDLDVEIDVTAP